jgi:hypothetical protein
MFSEAYYRIVENGKSFQNTSKSWNGLHTRYYAKAIKTLVEKHNATSLLDYGCGKGLQYTTNVKWESGVDCTLDQYLGLQSIHKFDPCVAEFDTYPSLDQKVDGIILIQCIGFIPDADISVLQKHLEKMSTKFCYIGERKPRGIGDVKPKKLSVLDQADCTTGRTAEWYKERFASWSGPELILDFI